MEISMFGRLRWLLVAAIVVAPVTVDWRRGFAWSEASAQYLDCDPVVLNYYTLGRYVGSQVMPRSPPPNCIAPTCVRWGACISEVRIVFGSLPQSKLNPNGCLLRICTPGSYRPRILNSAVK
jgi:hypothetical protein